jgi:hypothetical protein
MQVLCVNGSTVGHHLLNHINQWWFAQITSRIQNGEKNFRIFFFKILVYNGKLSRNQMVLKFFNFGYFSARNKVRSKSVSKSEKGSLDIVYTASQKFLKQRARSARHLKNEVAARAAPTIFVTLLVGVSRMTCHAIYGRTFSRRWNPNDGTLPRP